MYGQSRANRFPLLDRAAFALLLALEDRSLAGKTFGRRSLRFLSRDRTSL
jgi:hypothetical protein